MKIPLVLCAAAVLALTEGEKSCPDGHEKSKRNPSDCYPCLPGFYGSVERDRCFHCPHGYTTTYEGASGVSSCTSCYQGYRRDADSDECVVCPKGTYSDTLDAASCVSCPEGQTTRSEGTSDVAYCFDPSCPPGQYKGYWYQQCRSCARGTYSPDGQTQSCLKCPEGYTTPQRGAVSADECSVCWLGWYREGDECVPCPIGTFGENLEDETCVSCPKGMTTRKTGSFTCVCLDGYKKVFGAHKCIACPKGTYRSAGDWNWQCRSCPAGTTTTEEGQTSSSACVEE